MSRRGYDPRRGRPDILPPSNDQKDRQTQKDLVEDVDNREKENINQNKPEDYQQPKEKKSQNNNKITEPNKNQDVDKEENKEVDVISEVEKDNISEYIDETFSDKPEADEEVLNKKPVYDVHRKKEGKGIDYDVIREDSDNKQVKNIKETVVSKMLKDIEEDIIKTEVEIEIHEIIASQSKSENDLNINQRRVESYAKNLEYLIQKRKILKEKYKS